MPDARSLGPDDVMTTSSTETLETVFRYHQVTKHQIHRPAHGPGHLNWDTQPDPFRRYDGASLIALDRVPATEDPHYDDAYVEGRCPPAQLNRRGISQLFFDSLAISAWKRSGEATWALRVNPSSGNLHPTEGYLVCGAVDGLLAGPMVCHYAPKEHALEVRARVDPALWEALRERCPPETVFVGLTSVHWREAWKYGQRAYRYCQHDVGHAIAAVATAAAALGWQARLMDDLGTAELAGLLGIDSEHTAEPEEPDVLIAVGPHVRGMLERTLPSDPVARFARLEWHGTPNTLSPDHLDWGTDAPAAASRRPRGPSPGPRTQEPRTPGSRPARPVSLRTVIRQRRSAVAMDGRTRIDQDLFYRMLHRTVASPGQIPFSTLPWTPHIHLAIFVHRVDGLPPGLYMLIRDRTEQSRLKAACTRAAAWVRPPSCPEDLDLWCLFESDTRHTAQAVSCTQDIASDGCFSLGMIAAFERPLGHHGAWFYPRLFWEAGAIGQVLYLEAEAAGIRATGIGCYFDDAMHAVLGLEDTTYQDLYHFTVGGAVEDTRLTTLPAYPDCL
jgi:SagB-type dehydrogenase family enzyme